MSQPATNNKSASMESVVGLATQMCNAMAVCIREVHSYLAPKAAEYGVLLDAAAEHAWAMSLWIQLSRERAWLRMPATRFTKAEAKEERQPKTELFPRPEQPRSDMAPFANPAVSPALRKLRQMLKRDSIDEGELLAILRESTSQDERAPESLEEAPVRSLELLLSRWSIVRELVQAGRQDNGEAA